MTTTRVHTTIDSPVGPLRLVREGDALCGLHFLDGRDGDAPDDASEDASAFEDVRRQLHEYFAGTRRRFDLRLAPEGTAFQRQVWAELVRIPYGETISYGELAGRIANPRAVRAVGLANGANPIAIVVPCHRVIGSSGSLTGYGGGLDRKRFLLNLERGQTPFWGQTP